MEKCCYVSEKCSLYLTLWKHRLYLYLIFFDGDLNAWNGSAIHAFAWLTFAPITELKHLTDKLSQALFLIIQSINAYFS